MFMSNDYQDVQVLPASSDGSIFVLDMDNMYSRSAKVESYDYKNGMLVPSSSTPKQEFKQRQPVVRPSTSKASNPAKERYNASSNVFGNDPAMEETYDKFSIKMETPEYNESPKMHRNGAQKTHEELDYETNIQEHMIEITDLQRKSVQPTVNSRNLVVKAPEKPALGRIYLRKIKQHSRDIATIKKMLRKKSLMESKPDMSTILNLMKEQLPSTLYTILTLNLNTKCELSDEDVDFFATVHKTSPEVYQLLVDKYKWNLPCVDIVESTE
ncbi:hypothetical protein JTB14_011998 [Gonioctena quinquepunctata]|nr:hypothetical protein JTB14_011998 [Gonioctena quinquepunctata]